MYPHFPPWYAYSVVINLALLAVRVGVTKLNMIRAFLGTTAVLDHLLETPSSPNCRRNRSLAPWRID